MSSITSKLPKLLRGVNRSGDFYVTGTAEFFAPQLEVEDIGVISLPLLPPQAKQLLEAAERAPRGDGEQPLYDESVRLTWQTDGERVRLTGRRWEQSLQQIVQRTAEGLGVNAPVQAELYKLLIYCEGDFFVGPRDTEKAPGAFATLVIVPPSIYTGGELLIRLHEREVELDLKRDDPSDVAFAAFYADCAHEARPITSGCRLALIYNLRRAGKGLQPKPPDYRSEQDRIAELLRRWAAAKGKPGDGSPEKLVYPLEHAYTSAELSFDALKGADAAMVPVLAGAAESAACDLHLALVTIVESGVAEYTDSCGSRWGRYDDGEGLEAGDVVERWASLSNLIGFGGGSAPLSEIPLEDAELCPPGAFDDLEAADIEFHEATGDAGATFERAYRSGAFVLWPRKRRLAILNQGGLRVTLSYLSELVERWASGGGDRLAPEWREADELSGHMLGSWKAQSWLAGRDDGGRESNAHKMLTLLTQLGAAPRIASFLADVTAAGEFSPGDVEAIARAAELLQPARRAELIGQIISRNAAQDLKSCGALLARAAESADATAELKAPARVLLNLLPGDPAREQHAWRPRRQAPPAFVVDMIRALDRIDMALSERAVSYILTWPKTYSFDSALVPAMLALTEKHEGPETETMERVRRACVDHLRARVAQPLEPPADWTRSGVTTCSCEDCRDLNAFLASPDQQSWSLRAPEHKRSHIEEMARRNECELDMKTETRGKPYTLVCAKNQRNYDAHVQQRRDDLERLARLETPK
jgi:hypothetical protein